MLRAVTRAGRARGRAAGLLGTGLMAGALLTACGSDGPDPAPAAATHPATAAAAADTGGGDLAAGLLPAEAFGQGATVLRVPLDRLREMTPMPGVLSGVRLEPAGCAAALEQLLPRLAAVEDAAAEVAQAGGTATVEALARPGADVDAVGQLAAVVAACRTAEARSDEYGRATVRLETVDVSAVPAEGDRAVAVAVTVTVTRPDGGSWSGTGLAGLVQDGDRVLGLAQAAPQGNPLDPASFTALLQQAYDVQAAALD